MRSVGQTYEVAMTDLNSRWKQVCDRFDAEGYESLTHDERVWVNTRSLIDSVENGGLISYFYNSSADTYPDCRIALAKLGAGAVMSQLDLAARLFGNTVPVTVEARNQVIESWPDDGTEDAMLTEIDDTLMPLMGELEASLAAFLDAAGLAEEP